MSESSSQELVQAILQVSKKVDLILGSMRQDVIRIDAKYSPRSEFNCWRESEDGKNWKKQQYHHQKKCCAECKQPVELKGSHIDHIKPLSKYPALHLNLNNLRITCPDCNLYKGNRDN
jgi:5-methylcytosine-specific restriction endonuclease McrA